MFSVFDIQMKQKINLSTIKQCTSKVVRQYLSTSEILQFDDTFTFIEITQTHVKRTLLFDFHYGQSQVI